jgi:hypothetical protein
MKYKKKLLNFINRPFSHIITVFLLLSLLGIGYQRSGHWGWPVALVVLFLLWLLWGNVTSKNKK